MPRRRQHAGPRQPDERLALQFIQTLALAQINRAVLLRPHKGDPRHHAAQRWGLLGAIGAAGLVPGWRAYRLSLADGLSPRC